MTGVAQYRSKDSYDYKFRDLTKEVMNTMSIRALKAGLDSWDKDINLGLTSFALINIDEFDMLSRSQQPLLKHLISKSDVKMRPPYGKAYEQRKRYASFIATTNKTFPNFHLTKSINIEVGRALSQLGYKPHKTNTCQMYSIEEK